MTPKNKENVAALVEKIIEKDHGMIHIKDSNLIPYYVHNSKHMAEVEDENKTKLNLFFSEEKTYEQDLEDTKKKQLRLAEKVCANYVFASYFYQDRHLVSINTPFRIISEQEEEFLLKNFYKNVPEKVSKAAGELKIVLYDKLYSCYVQGDTTYVQGDTTKLWEVLHNNKSSWDNLSPFLNFVFDLPYEEQNIESNKKIIRTFSSGYDIIKIMTKEYSEGKHFQEYFENISHFAEKKVIEAIKGLERKPDYDVYLLKKGYVIGGDSAINLYGQDTQGFINYFQKLGNESQKIIIEKIYENSFVNQEVVDWLEKGYTNLLREVGFSGGKQNGSNK